MTIEDIKKLDIPSVHRYLSVYDSEERSFTSARLRA